MKKALIMCLFVLLGANVGQCSTTYFPPLQPIGGAAPIVDNSLASLQDPLTGASLPGPSVSYPKINEVERSLYGQMFTTQDILIRLSRIEKSLFSTTYPNSTLAQRVDNIIMNFNQINQYPNISKAELSKIEAKVFGRNYAQNDTPVRIERLEQELLGAVQNGEMESRYETVKVAASNYNSQPADFYQTPLAQNSIGGNPRHWKGILGTLGSVFFGTGALTGFSPPLDPFYNNTAYGGNGYDNFANLGGSGLGGNPGYGMYSGNRTNRGYSDQYKSYGTGSRVTILD